MTAYRWFLNGRSWVKVAMTIGVVWLVNSPIGCERSTEGKKAAHAIPAVPPSVVVAEVIRKTVPIYREFVARTDAEETVEIRARVQAFLLEQHFTEGTMVKKDQLLFTLDAREYEAQLTQAEAQLAKARADLAFARDKATVESAKANVEVARARLGKAETDERRLKPLAERRAVPQQDYDNAVANLDAARAELASRLASQNTAEVNQKSSIAQAEAAVASASAAIAQAQLNLDYCTIKSPIEGLIGERLVSPGNLVGKGDATLLDTVSSIDPIRVHLSLSDAEYLRFMALREKGQTSAGAAMKLLLADGTVYKHEGRGVIADRAVDLKTGTLSLVAEFPNPDGLLRPGQFGRVRVAAEIVENAILVPRRAVREDQGAKYVVVVGADDVAARRTIMPAGTAGDLLIVREGNTPGAGVTPGELVIVEGIEKAKPGFKVAPSAAGGGRPDAKAGEKPPAAPAASAGGE